MNVCERMTKDIFISEIIDEGRFIHVKDTNGDIGTIGCRLAVKKSVSQFCPMSVACESD
jgi:hypothetical protein